MGLGRQPWMMTRERREQKNVSVGSTWPGDGNDTYPPADDKTRGAATTVHSASCQSPPLLMHLPGWHFGRSVPTPHYAGLHNSDDTSVVRGDRQGGGTGTITQRTLSTASPPGTRPHASLYCVRQDPRPGSW